MHAFNSVGLSYHKLTMAMGTQVIIIMKELIHTIHNKISAYIVSDVDLSS